MLNRRHIITTASLLAASGSLPKLVFAGAPILGLSLPATGPQAEVAKDLLAGYETALKAVGGPLQLSVLDDSSVPEKTAKNVEILAADPQVIGISGIVGTPHAQMALPVAVRLGLPVVGIRSGASSLRNGQEGVFHLRASFEDELDKIAGMCAGAGLKKIAIVYSDDSFGQGTNTHLKSKLESLGIGILSSSPVNRNGEKMSEVLDRVGNDVSKANAPTGVVLLLIAKPMTDALKELREKHRIVMPIFAMSFVATRSLMTSRDPSLTGLGLVTAFPLTRSLGDGLAAQYKTDITAQGKPELAESLTAFEGYFYGSVFARAAAAGYSRASLVKRLSAGVNFAGRDLAFDKKKVGFHYLEVIRKVGSDGKFRA